MIRNCILKALSRKKLSTSDLVLMCPDVGRATLYRYVAGTSDLTVKKLESVCKALGLTVKVTMTRGKNDVAGKIK